MKRYITSLSLLVISLALSAQQKPKNIIFLIGDGMGLAQITAGITVADNTQYIEQMPVIGLIKTHSANDFVTDSAAGATAFATGTKTNNGMISMNPDSIPLTTILEMAELEGLATGLVSTSAITHATPASFIAHDLSRNNYEEIAADFLDTDIDVFMGGGLNHFTKRKDNRNLVRELQEKKYTVITDKEELNNLQPDGKVAALLADEHLKRYAAGRGDLLPEMTQKTLDILSKNKKGFFLMVEGSQIDWGGHANSINYITNEFIDFDHTIGVALEFAKKNPGTLIVITADHETGGLGLNGYDEETNKLKDKYTTRHHTGIMIPVFAYGPGADNFAGIYQNTEIFDKMVKLLKLNNKKAINDVTSLE